MPQNLLTIPVIVDKQITWKKNFSRTLSDASSWMASKKSRQAKVEAKVDGKQKLFTLESKLTIFCYQFMT